MHTARLAVLVIVGFIVATVVPLGAVVVIDHGQICVQISQNGIPYDDLIWISLASRRATTATTPPRPAQEMIDLTSHWQGLNIYQQGGTGAAVRPLNAAFAWLITIDFTNPDLRFWAGNTSTKLTINLASTNQGTWALYGEPLGFPAPREGTVALVTCPDPSAPPAAPHDRNARFAAEF